MIQDAGSYSEPNQGRDWSEAGDSLLKTLYVERGCPVDVIASVFKLDDVQVRERIETLRLDDLGGSGD